MTKRFINIILSILIFITVGFSNLAEGAHHETDEMDTASETADEAVFSDSTAYIEVQRADIRARRMQFAAAYMNLSEEEGTKFWPIYREYEFELSQYFDGKIAAIGDYINNVSSLTDEKAREIASRFFKQEEERIAIRGGLR